MTSKFENQILNAGLEELLGSNKRPDVTARVLEKFENNKLNADRNSATPELNSADVVTINKEISHKATTHASASKRKNVILILASLATIFVVALTVALALILSNLNNGSNVADSHPDSSSDKLANEEGTINDGLAHQPETEQPDQPNIREHSVPELDGSSGNESIAENNQPGTSDSIDKPTEYPVLKPGELVVPPRFARVTPVENAISTRELTDLINQSLQETWNRNSLEPASKLADDTWLVRASNRLIGETPGADEIQHLRNKLDDEGRASVVHYLMNSENYRPRFVEHLANSMAMRLMGLHPDLPVSDNANLNGLKEFLKQSLLEEKPWDQVVYELISAVGNIDPAADDFNPATNFLTMVAKRHGNDRENWTSHFSQVFLNQNLRCAQCHQSSDQQIAQEQFWQLNSYFAQTHFAQDQSGSIRLMNLDYLPDGQASLESAPVNFTNPDGTIDSVFPALLDGEIESESGLVKQFDRRTELANRVAGSDYWRKSLVNHVWSLMLSSPLEPHNRNQDPELGTLQSNLAQQVAASGYDVEPLIEAIALSNAFALAVEEDNEQVADQPMLGTEALFTRFYNHPVSFRRADEALAIVNRAYTSKESDLVEMRGVLAQRIGGAKIKTPDVIKVTEGLPEKQAGWGQSLENSLILQRIIDSKMTDEQKVEHLIISALKRPAKPAEIEQCLSILSSSDDKHRAYQDIWWALFNSFEFTLPSGIR